MSTFEGDKLIAFIDRFIAQYDETFYELHRLAVIAFMHYSGYIDSI